MADLINRETLRFSRGFNDDGILYVPYGDIAIAPSVDAVPVVHGHWIKHDYAEESEGLLIPNYECSVCHSWLRDYRDYCGDCGAKMDEKDDDSDGK